MVCLYLVARSAWDWRWLLAGILAAGVGAAFKYPGASALVLVFAAAWFLDPEHRYRRIALAGLGLPLFVVGFLLFFPAVLTDPAKLIAVLRFDSTYAGGVAWDSVRHILQYPWFLAKTTGVILPLWGLAAILYSLVRPRREAWIILCWLLPYLAFMTSSWFVVARYALPWVSVLGLLMARVTKELLDRTQPRFRPWTIAGFSLAGLLILAPTCVHLRTMSRPDPRNLAAAWIRIHVPLHAAVAATPSFNHDRFFVVTLDPEQYQITPLSFRKDQDASSYLAQPFRLLAANERAWAQGFLPRSPSQTLFWKQVMESKDWELLARFSNRPAWPGLFLHGQLPEDFCYLYQETRIYQRNP
jgi:4-amino-4-deoxy-L-arabinose transferase-like glycosyltransferase